MIIICSKCGIKTYTNNNSIYCDDCLDSLIVKPLPKAFKVLP